MKTLEKYWYIFVAAIIFVLYYLSGNKKTQQVIQHDINNNPLNIRSTSTQWRGKIGTDKNGFCVFDTMENGLRAAFVNFRTQWRKDANTIYIMINRWAPPSENDTNAYIEKVVAITGIPHDFLFPFEPAYVCKIIGAMAKVETGKEFTYDELLNAYNSM